MLPWGHAAVGYLLYSSWQRLGRGRTPTWPGVPALLVGTQAPDLIDKPLAWSVALLPSGRSLAHSLLVLGALTLLALALRERVDEDWRTVTAAGLLGWGLHVASDAALSLVAGDGCLAFLAWPLAGTCPYENDDSFAQHVAAFELTAPVTAGIALTMLAAAVWLADGRPGLRTLRSLIPGRERP